MKVLVFGRTGQVATELARHPGVTVLGRDQADLRNPEACAALVNETDADVVINAAAYTDVDRAEEEEALATLINGAAPGAMARAAANRSLPFLHISTDYVFGDSAEGARAPDAPTLPLNAYGRSKLAGEGAVRDAQGRHIILRTSWVFSAYGANFVKTMLRLADTRHALNVVNDQIGGPTPAADIATTLLRMAELMGNETRPSGTYHYGGQPATSWARFAREIFKQARRDVVVTGIPTSEYPTLAKRPLNSRLDGASLASDYAIAQPDWQAGLTDVLHKLHEG